MTDQELEMLEKMKKGDKKSFEEMVFRYERAIFSHCLSMVKNREIAEDITQDVFIKVYLNINKIDLEKSFKSWLYKIATNTVYDYFRKKSTKEEFLLIDDENSPIETIDPKDTYLDIESKNDLEKALNKLKPIHKTILMMYYFEGFSYEEIAGIISAPINTIKTHLFRAKKELKEKIQYD